MTSAGSAADASTARRASRSDTWVSAVSIEGFESIWSPLRQDTPRPDAQAQVVFTAAGDAAHNGFRFLGVVRLVGLRLAADLAAFEFAQERPRRIGFHQEIDIEFVNLLVLKRGQDLPDVFLRDLHLDFPGAFLEADAQNRLARLGLLAEPLVFKVGGEDRPLALPREFV